LREKYRTERDRRLRADGSTQYLELSGTLAEYCEVDPHPPFVERDPLSIGTDVVILGYWNRFPGVQCDNDSYCYIPRN
jgi:cyclohexanone monooxygenase